MKDPDERGSNAIRGKEDPSELSPHRSRHEECSPDYGAGTDNKTYVQHSVEYTDLEVLRCSDKTNVSAQHHRKRLKLV